MKDIDARFEMELAYYEMCAEETISNLVLTEAERNLQGSVSKIVSTVKSTIKKIFDALSRVLLKISEKFSKLIHGKSLKDDVNELKTQVSSAPKETQNTEVEVDDVKSMMKINSEARKEVQRFQKDIESGKEVSSEEIDSKMKQYKEDIDKIKTKGKIKTSVKVAIAGTAVAAYAIPFTINVAKGHNSLMNIVCPIGALAMNSMADKNKNSKSVVKLASFNAAVGNNTADTVYKAADNTKKIRGIFGKNKNLKDGNTTYSDKDKDFLDLIVTLSTIYSKTDAYLKK